MSTLSNSVNRVNRVNRVNSVNSFNSYSAVLPPSPMVFFVENICDIFRTTTSDHTLTLKRFSVEL